MKKQILELCREGKGKKKIASTTGITVDKAKTYIKNYKNKTFKEYLNSTNGEIVVATIKPKQLYINMLRSFGFEDNKRIVETLSVININVSISTLIRSKREDILVPVNEDFNYLKGIYTNTIGLNENGFITNNNFFGTGKDKFGKHKKSIIRLVRCIEIQGYEKTFNEEKEWLAKKIGEIDLTSFFEFYLWKIAKVLVHQDVELLDKVDYIYYSTVGYDTLTIEQKEYLQKQKEQGKIFLNKIYIKDNENDDWGVEVDNTKYDDINTQDVVNEEQKEVVEPTIQEVISNMAQETDKKEFTPKYTGDFRDILNDCINNTDNNKDFVL